MGFTNADRFAKLDDDRRHQQDGRHVVEEGRHDGRDQAEDGQKRPDAAFRHFEGHEAEPVEDAGLGQDRDDDHHAE